MTAAFGGFLIGFSVGAGVVVAMLEYYRWRQRKRWHVTTSDAGPIERHGPDGRRIE